MNGHALGNGRMFPWRNLVQNRPDPPLSAGSFVFGWPGKPVDEPGENGTLQESSTEEKAGSSGLVVSCNLVLARQVGPNRCAMARLRAH